MWLDSLNNSDNNFDIYPSFLSICSNTVLTNDRLVGAYKFP